MVEGVLSSFPCAQHMRQAQCGPRDTELSNSDFNTKKSHCSTPLGMDRPSAPDCCSSCKCWKYSWDQPCPWVDTWSCWKTALPMTWIGGPCYISLWWPHDVPIKTVGEPVLVAATGFSSCSQGGDTPWQLGKAWKSMAQHTCVCICIPYLYINI